MLMFLKCWGFILGVILAYVLSMIPIYKIVQYMIGYCDKHSVRENIIAISCLLVAGSAIASFVMTIVFHMKI